MTANNEIEKIMESMGWTDGTFIPIANEENKILMQGMQEQLAEKESLTDRNQELDKRATNLKQHIVNSQSDILQNAVGNISLDPMAVIKQIFRFAYRN